MADAGERLQLRSTADCAGSDAVQHPGPGVITRHHTAGALVSLGGGYELKTYYLYAPENTVNGSNSIPPNTGLVPLPPQSFGGGEANIRLNEQAVGLALGIKF